MPCTICADPKVVAKGRCMTCWKYHRRNGCDRTEEHMIRLTERDVEKDLQRRLS